MKSKRRMFFSYLRIEKWLRRKVRKNVSDFYAIFNDFSGKADRFHFVRTFYFK